MTSNIICFKEDTKVATTTKSGKGDMFHSRPLLSFQIPLLLDLIDFFFFFLTILRIRHHMNESHVI